MRIIYLFIFMMFVSCKGENSQIYNLISKYGSSGVPIDSTGIDDNKQPYRVSYSTWKKDVITYYVDYSPITIDPSTKTVLPTPISNYFTDEDKGYMDARIALAATHWAPHVNKIIHQVDNKNDADFIISWGFVDRKGKDLADADWPPVAGQTNKPEITIDFSDMYTEVKKKDKASLPFYNLILHELGHTIAGLRHDDSRGIMNTTFKFSSLRLDDIAGARINYKNFEDFTFEGNKYIFLNAKDKNKNLTANFKVKEFLSKCTYASPEGHFLCNTVIQAVQYLRFAYNQPITILSSYRGVACNNAAGGASASQHLERNALDFKFVGRNAPNVQNVYESDIIHRKVVLQNLLRMGVRGFGSYPYGYGTNHIDARSSNAWNTYYNRVGYMTWGEFKSSGRWYDVVLEKSMYE